MAQANNSGGSLKAGQKAKSSGQKSGQKSSKSSEGKSRSAVSTKATSNKATGSRSGGTQKARATGNSSGDKGSDFHLLDKDLSGKPFDKPADFRLLDKDFEGKPLTKEPRYTLLDKKDLSFLNNQSDSFAGLRCSDYADPGHIVVIIGNDLDHSIGVDFNAAKGVIFVASLAAARVLGPALESMHATLGAGAALEIFNEVAVHTGIEHGMEKALHALHVEPRPGRCYVFQPDKLKLTRFK